MLYLANWCINAMNTLGELCTLMVIWVVESFKRGVSILDSLYLAGYKESRILSGGCKIRYRKVANSSLSQLVAHFQIFRRLVKGKFDAYVL